MAVLLPSPIYRRERAQVWGNISSPAARPAVVLCVQLTMFKGYIFNPLHGALL